MEQIVRRDGRIYYGERPRRDAEEALAEESKNAMGGEITAPIAGTITAVNVQSGKETDPATPVVVMQPEKKAYVRYGQTRTRYSSSMRSDISRAMSRALPPESCAECVTSSQASSRPKGSTRSVYS